MTVSLRGDAPGLAVVLGGAGVSLHDLVAGYAALAQGGLRVVLHDRAGNIAGGENGARVTGPVAAWYVGAILSQVQPPDGRPAGRVAYKTGTSYGHRDALSVGWDDRFGVGIWMGRADGTPVPGAFGRQAAAPLLVDLFDALARVRAPWGRPRPMR